jgi:hypothetical protein
MSRSYAQDYQQVKVRPVRLYLSYPHYPHPLLLLLLNLLLNLLKYLARPKSPQKFSNSFSEDQGEDSETRFKVSLRRSHARSNS